MNDLDSRTPQPAKEAAVSSTKFEGAVRSKEEVHAAATLSELLKMRRYYMTKMGFGLTPTVMRIIEEIDSTDARTLNAKPKPPASVWDAEVRTANESVDASDTLSRSNGVFDVLNASGASICEAVTTREEFLNDMRTIKRACSDKFLQTFCCNRLTALKLDYEKHITDCFDAEQMEQEDAAASFDSVAKVDCHLHGTACMSSKKLLAFITAKLASEGERQVVKEGQQATLKEVFSRNNVTAAKMNIDGMRVKCDKTIFLRFDRFNYRYNPFGSWEIRDLFLNRTNGVDGVYLAEMMRDVVAGYSEDNIYGEPRMTIHGKNKSEWTELAKWITSNELLSARLVWIIQVPRKYDYHRKSKSVANFDEVLDNLFRPLFEATIHPNEHPELVQFLEHVTGFDSVDDESVLDLEPFSINSPEPAKYSDEQNPAYEYYIYYMYINLQRLNDLRRSKGLNVFSMRPHSGESGDYFHLATAFLTSQAISHGTLLSECVVLEYLYYLVQLPIAASPISNNALFVKLSAHPFAKLYRKGQNITLSSDNPLLFHLRTGGLMEEYAMAAHTWNLSSVELCEIARTSVLHSGFSKEAKREMLGNRHESGLPLENDIQRTNVPDIRLQYRQAMLQRELQLVMQ